MTRSMSPPSLFNANQDRQRPLFLFVYVYHDLNTSRPKDMDGQVLRSTHSDAVSYVMIYNLSGSDVDANWVGYDSGLVMYKRIRHKQSWQVKTFVTHPWVFLRSGTKDRMNVATTGKILDVLHPKGYEEGEPQSVRLHVILRPVYSLKQLCFRRLHAIDLCIEGLKGQLPQSLLQEYRHFIDSVIH